MIAGVHAVRKPHRDVWHFPQSCHDEKEGQLAHRLENKVLLLSFLKVSYAVMLVLNFSCSQGWLSTLIFLTSAMLGHKCTLLYLVLCSAGTKFGFHAWSASTLPTKVHTQLLLCFCFMQVSYVAPVGLKHIMWPRITLNSWSSCFLPCKYCFVFMCYYA